MVKKSVWKKTEIDDLSDDIIQNILSRLPALTFAFAACVNTSWNSISNRILLSPKLSSSVSFNTSLEIAVNEVVDKVLSIPIRPHFALASIGPSFSLEFAHQLIGKRLGSEACLIINVSEGVIGKDLHSNNFVEVQWAETDGEDFDDEESSDFPNENAAKGIMLTVGYLPGLKTHIVPLSIPNTRGVQTPVVGGHFVDEFLMDIKAKASAVSDSESPAGIMFFAERKTDMKPVLQKMEFAFSSETAIVGAGCSKFLCRSNTINTRPRSTTVAVALLFSRDKNKSSGIGETNFHVMLSTGLSPVGLTYKASSVKCYPSATFLIAAKEKLHEHIDGVTILEEVYEEVGDPILNPCFYIGVIKTRKCTIGEEKVKRMQFLEFHEVSGGNEEYLFVRSAGIKTGDPFRFYISNSETAISSSQRVSNEFKHLASIHEREVFGSIIFSCCGRRDSFLGKPNIDSALFVDNFPDVPFGGTYCAGEIARKNLNAYDQDYEEGGSVFSLEHYFGTVYLVMSYTPPRPQQN